MIYYWFLVILLLFLCNAGAKSPKRNSILLLCVFLFFVFFAFRIGFTPDYKNYEDSYKFLHSGRINQELKTEIGYQWLCKVLPSYRAVLIVFTFLFSTCIYIAFKDYIKPRYWVMAMAILLCYEPFVLGNMAGMRSGFVTCFFFLAIIAKEKYKKWGIIVALGLMGVAFMFHRSSIGLLPLIFLPGRPFNKYVNYLLYVLVAVLLYLSIRYANEINMATLAFSQDVFERGEYKTYFEDEIDVSYNVMMLIKIAMTVVLMYLTLKYSNEESHAGKSSFLKYTTFLYIIMVIPLSNIVGRFLYYFAFPCIIATPIAVEKASKEMKIVYISFLVMLIIIQLRTFYRADSLSYYMQYSNILMPF